MRSRTKHQAILPAEGKGGLSWAFGTRLRQTPTAGTKAHRTVWQSVALVLRTTWKTVNSYTTKDSILGQHFVSGTVVGNQISYH